MAATSTSHATTTKPTNVLRAGSASLPQWDRRVRTTRSPGSTYFRRVRCPASVCSTVFMASLGEVRKNVAKLENALTMMSQRAFTTSAARSGLVTMAYTRKIAMIQKRAVLIFGGMEVLAGRRRMARGAVGRGRSGEHGRGQAGGSTRGEGRPAPPVSAKRTYRTAPRGGAHTGSGLVAVLSRVGGACPTSRLDPCPPSLATRSRAWRAWHGSTSRRRSSTASRASSTSSSSRSPA